jgi:hypothetical protein
MAQWFSWIPGLFVAGTFTFWAFIIAINIFVIVLQERDHDFWPAVLLIITVLTLQWLSNFKPFSLLTVNGVLWAVGYVIAYLAIGTVWSLIKGWRYLINKRDELLDRARHTDGQTRLNILSNTPSADNTYTREKIIHWIMFWPWSVIAFMLSDMVQTIGRAIYERMGKVYTAIANHVFASVMGEIERLKAQIETEKQTGGKP